MEKVLEKNCKIKYNNLIYKQPINERYFCKLCNCIFDNVHQAECGCRYCFECLNNVDKCDFCGDAFIEKTIIKDKAFQREINNQIVECIGCEWSGTLENYLKHYIESHDNFVCGYCKNIFKNVVAFSKHIEDYPNRQCTKVKEMKNCIYHSIGCKMVSLSSETSEQHMKESMALHLELIYSYIKENTKNKLNSTSDRNIIQNNFENSKNSHFQADEALIFKHKKSKFDDLPTNTYSEIATKPNKANEILQETFTFQEKSSFELEIFKQNKEKLKNEILNLKKALTLSQTTIIELKDKLRGAENSCFNGIYLWKIENLSQKISDSKSGKQTSFYSPPFYSHPNGYKMCARIYLNGDGMGRSTHISVFFVLMKGEFDALLFWPFSQKVTFILIDQVEIESKENIIDAFRPDPNSASFQKPISDMNIASGIPLFCALTKFNSNDHQYIKNDTMFIKILVDSRKLPDIN